MPLCFCTGAWSELEQVVNTGCLTMENKSKKFALLDSYCLAVSVSMSCNNFGCIVVFST